MTATPDINVQATALRHAMPDSWHGSYAPQVVRAMTTVPRHAFLPGHSLEEAYGENATVTHRDDDGSVRSCATIPSCMASMLSWLDIHPGHRVLEIGAGTGYNAALLSELVGPDGQVTTIDIHDDVAAAAREHLAATGSTNVQVITGDGTDGHPDRAPYDRIIITAGAWEIPPAWLDQAADGCRMVVPLRIAGYTNIVTLDLRPDRQTWVSVHRDPLMFIHMRGPGHHVERDVPVTPGGEAELRMEGDWAAEAAVLRRAAGHAPTTVWTQTVAKGGRLDDLEPWLASLGGLGRLIFRRQSHGLVPAIGSGGGLAVLDVSSGDTFAYITGREAGGMDRELGVVAYGPRGDDLAKRVGDRVRAWGTEHERLDTWVEVHPAGSPVPEGCLLVSDKENVRVVVRARPEKRLNVVTERVGA